MAEKLADEVERTDPTVHAFLDFDRPRLLGAAAALDQRPRARHGPLHGLAIAVKEVFDVTSHRCCWGLPSLHDRIATRDAALVAKMKELGGQVAGPTLATQLASAPRGPTPTPSELPPNPG